MERGEKPHKRKSSFFSSEHLSFSRTAAIIWPKFSHCVVLGFGGDEEKPKIQIQTSHHQYASGYQGSATGDSPPRTASSLANSLSPATPHSPWAFDSQSNLSSHVKGRSSQSWPDQRTAPSFPMPQPPFVDRDHRDHHEYELAASDLTGYVKTGGRAQFESAYSSILEGRWKNLKVDQHIRIPPDTIAYQICYKIHQVAVKVIRNPGNMDPEVIRRVRWRLNLWLIADYKLPEIPSRSRSLENFRPPVCSALVRLRRRYWLFRRHGLASMTCSYFVYSCWYASSGVDSEIWLGS